MITHVSLRTVFNCTLERAFKTPFLSDIRKVHTGSFISPKVTHCSEDENWGNVGATKKVFVVKTFLTKEGYALNDSILERKENEYWKVKVDNFQNAMFGFTHFIGEWQTTELENNRVEVVYSYQLHSKYWLLSPIHWLFGKIFWRKYMKQVLDNIKNMVQNEEPYLFD